MRTETTFPNFSKKKKLNSSQYCRMSFLLSSLPRKKKGNCFVYDETDLERLYQNMPLLKKAPDGYITAITFFRKYKEFEPYRGSIITYMSNLALQGLIKIVLYPFQFQYKLVCHFQILLSISLFALFYF